MLHDAALAAIPVIRVGLQPTADLVAGGEIVAGPFHPAFRQLAEGERWYDLLQILCDGFDQEARLTIQAPAARIADVVGQKRQNIIRLSEISGRAVAAVTVVDSLAAGAIRISDGRRTISGDILRDLHYQQDFKGTF